MQQPRQRGEQSKLRWPPPLRRATGAAAGWQWQQTRHAHACVPRSELSPAANATAQPPGRHSVQSLSASRPAPPHHHIIPHTRPYPTVHRQEGPDV